MPAPLALPGHGVQLRQSAIGRRDLLPTSVGASSGTAGLDVRIAVSFRAEWHRPLSVGLANQLIQARHRRGSVNNPGRAETRALPGSAETVLVGFLLSINRAVVGPYSRCRASSYSAGGTPPSEVWRRSVLNQATYSTIASSSWERVRQTRSRISSVLKLSTKLSASALSYASPTVPIEGEHAGVVEGAGCSRRRVLPSSTGRRNTGLLT